MSKTFKVLGNAFRGLNRLFFGSEEYRRYCKVLVECYVFDDDRSYEEQHGEATDFYRRRLTEAGYDPAESPRDIEGSVSYSYNKQYRVYDRYFRELDQYRAQVRADADAARPRLGSDEHMRQEAERTFAATGVYGLPNSGGYVLNRADKERLGLLY